MCLVVDWFGEQARMCYTLPWRGRSSVVERRSDKAEVDGSIPSARTAGE